MPLTKQPRWLLWTWLVEHEELSWLLCQGGMAASFTPRTGAFQMDPRRPRETDQ